MRALMLLLCGCGPATASSFHAVDKPSDFLLEVRKGNVAGHTTALMSGHTETATTTSSTVGPLPDDTQITILSRAGADTCAVASTSANDTSAGTGARTVLVSGLDSSGDAQSETVTLSGQTEADCVNAYSAINGATVLTAGSGGVNAGRIYVGSSSDTWTAGVPQTFYYGIETGWNLGRTAVFTIPNGKTGYVLSSIFSGEAGKTGSGRLLATTADGGLLYSIFELETTAQAAHIVGAHGSTPLAAGATLTARVAMSAGTGGDFTFNTPILLVDN